MLLFAVNKKESPAAGFVEFTLDGSTLLTVPDASTLLPSTPLRDSEQGTVSVPPFDGLRDAERESKREQTRRERRRRERSQGLGMTDTFFISLLN
jgi:hypothetical protein